MCVLISLQFFSETFLILRKKWVRYDQKCKSAFMSSTRYSCPILMKVECSRLVFEKSLKIKFHENRSCGSRVVPCRWTDGQMDRGTDMMKLVVTFFCNFANAPKNATRKGSVRANCKIQNTKLVLEKTTKQMWISGCGSFLLFLCVCNNSWEYTNWYR